MLSKADIEVNTQKCLFFFFGCSLVHDMQLPTKKGVAERNHNKKKESFHIFYDATDAKLLLQSCGKREEEGGGGGAGWKRREEVVAAAITSDKDEFLRLSQTILTPHLSCD